jgi:hypothetical protein
MILTFISRAAALVSSAIVRELGQPWKKKTGSPPALPYSTKASRPPFFSDKTLKSFSIGLRVSAESKLGKILFAGCKSRCNFLHVDGIRFS